MRADELNEPLLLVEECVLPALGGDGKVIVSGITWSQKLVVLKLEEGDRMMHLLSKCVLDEDGNEIMTPHQWDIFAGRFQEDFIRLAETANRVNGFVRDEVKKD